MASDTGQTADLRYVEAASVRCSDGSLSGFRLCTEDGQLGSVEGVLISPSARRLAFFVVDSPGLFAHRHYLVPIEAGAVVDETPRTLRIPARKDQLALQAFTPDSVPGFSEDDLLAAMFAGR